ncbi:MAG: LuxR C-terminal-related transcriptional regulator [Vulcanimicrobiota bacterium]
MLTPVLVVAGSNATRRGLAGLLASTDDFVAAGSCDWSAPAPEGAELLLGELVSGDPIPSLVLPFLLLSDRRDLALEPGPGRGLLARQADDTAVLAALRAVRAGLWVSDRFGQARPDGPDALTAREIEVLELLAEGLPNKQLAELLGISENTVKFHLSSVFSKLAVSSRTEAVTAGIRLGYLLV